MCTSETFYVSTKTNKVKKTTEPDREYFKGGKKDGKAEYLIEIFGYNHKENAKKVQRMVENSELKNNLFFIKVETIDK